MPSDTGSRLESASAGPSRSPNVDEIWDTARRRNRVARIGASAAVLLAVAVPLGAYGLVSDKGPSEVAPSDGRGEGTGVVICDAVFTEGCVPHNTDLARYAVTVSASGDYIADKEEASGAGVVNGVVEIDPLGESACLSLSGLSFTDAYLSDGTTTVGLPPKQAVAGDICVEASVRDLGLINGDPDRFLLEIELSSGEMSTAALRYMDQSGEEGVPCADVHITPSYLPWLNATDQIPEPETSVTPDGRGSLRLWSPSARTNEIQVKISIFSAREAIRGTETNIRLLDSRGYLDTYANGSLAFSWDLETGSCDRVVLELDPPDGTPSPVTQKEIVKIARSLQYGVNVLSPTDDTRCGAPPVRPTHLPWLAAGERVPEPTDSYDSTIDRYQLGWEDPRFDAGEAGIGLSIYPLSNAPDGGERTRIVVDRAEGRLHRGEGDSISISWHLEQDCNYLELTIANPEADVEELRTQVMRVARSLENVSTTRALYEPPSFPPAPGWFSNDSGPQPEGRNPKHGRRRSTSAIASIMRS